MDSMTYGPPAQKHLDKMEKQSGDPSTALGRFFRGRIEIPIPPPPRNSSTKTLNELNYIISRMRESTESDRTYAIRMDDLPSHHMMWSYEATEITGIRYKTGWFDRISEMGDGFLNYLKIRYGRPRPYQIAPLYEKTIRRIIKDPRTAAYPSGHSFDAWLFATILSNRHPQYTEEFEEIANRVSDSRVVAGVHYPSDLEAGRIAAVYAVNHRLVEVR